MTRQAIVGVDPNPFRNWGMWAVLAGALALVLVFVQIAAPGFEAKPSVASQVGEIAGEIKRSAWRTFLGLPRPEAAVQPLTWGQTLLQSLSVAAPILAVLAVVLSLVSAIRRENWRFPAYATGLGVSAIVLQFLWWVALLIVGALLLVAIIENIGDIFSF